MFRPLNIYESIDKKEAFEPILEHTNYAKVLCSKIIDYKDSSSTTYDFYRVYVPNNLILNTPNELVTLNAAINQGDTIIESVKIHKHLPVLIIEVFKTTPNTHSTYFERRYVDTTEIVENFISENSEK